jgi:hypothetical protein
MINITYPEVTNLQVVATQPKSADLRNIEFMQATENTTLDRITYIVKINLSNKPQVTSRGFSIYLGDYRINKYSEFPGGIYFKVYNPRFFAEHTGKKLLFSTSGMTFHDSGYQLPSRAENARESFMIENLNALPTQEEVLR